MNRQQCNDAASHHTRLAFNELMSQPKPMADCYKTGTRPVFKAASNAYGNWYGYVSGRRETMFFGDYIDQQFTAFDWVKTLGQAQALKALKGGR